MRQLFVWTAVAVAPGLLSGGQGSEDTPLQVGVVVRNESAASSAIVHEAESQCAATFKRAGIEIAWMNSAEDIRWYGPDLVLRAAILHKAPTRFAIHILGSALPFTASGVQMRVFYNSVVALSTSVSLQPSQVLAAALEHELGHMLLGSADHAIGGIMREHWNRQDLDYIGRGYLGFFRKEKEQMRSHIRAVSAKPHWENDPSSSTMAKTGDRSIP